MFFLKATGFAVFFCGFQVDGNSRNPATAVFFSRQFDCGCGTCPNVSKALAVLAQLRTMLCF